MITFNEPENIQDILQRVIKDLKSKSGSGKDSNEKK